MIFNIKKANEYIKKLEAQIISLGGTPIAAPADNKSTLSNVAPVVKSAVRSIASAGMSGLSRVEAAFAAAAKKPVQ